MNPDAMGVYTTFPPEGLAFMVRNARAIVVLIFFHKLHFCVRGTYSSVAVSEHIVCCEVQSFRCSGSKAALLFLM